MYSAELFPQIDLLEYAHDSAGVDGGTAVSDHPNAGLLYEISEANQPASGSSYPVYDGRQALIHGVIYRDAGTAAPVLV